jgi:DNA-binding CsgD family transcriptional regulator
VKWCTPRARELLREWAPPDAAQPPALPDGVVRQLLALRPGNGAAQCMLDVGSMQLECVALSPAEPGELLFRLSECRATDEQSILQQQLAVTGREAEVLLWLSRGKSNREIGQILDISPRTVNKHLEQIFIKLGVENRASAAARAVRLLSQ